MARSSSVSSIASFVLHPDAQRDEPETAQRGEIWAAQASAILPILEAAASCSAVGLSAAMQTSKDFLDQGGEKLPVRPCLILSTRPGIVRCMALTTLDRGATHVSHMSPHFQHFAISVGRTEAWPTPESWVLQTVPRWGKVPQYVTACAIEIPYSSLVHRFRTASGTPYGCSAVTMLRLERRSFAMTTSLAAKQPVELAEWNDLHDISLKAHKESSRTGNGSSSYTTQNKQRRPLSLPQGFMSPGFNPHPTSCPSVSHSSQGHFTSGPVPPPFMNAPPASPSRPDMFYIQQYYPAQPVYSPIYHDAFQPDHGQWLPSVEARAGREYRRLSELVPPNSQAVPPLSESPDTSESSSGSSPPRSQESTTPFGVDPSSSQHSPGALSGCSAPVIQSPAQNVEKDAVVIPPVPQAEAEQPEKPALSEAARAAMDFVRGPMFHGYHDAHSRRMGIGPRATDFGVQPPSFTSPRTVL